MSWGRAQWRRTCEEIQIYSIEVKGKVFKRSQSWWTWRQVFFWRSWRRSKSWGDGYAFQKTSASSCSGEGIPNLSLHPSPLLVVQWRGWKIDFWKGRFGGVGRLAQSLHKGIRVRVKLGRGQFLPSAYTPMKIGKKGVWTPYLWKPLHTWETYFLDKANTLNPKCSGEKKFPILAPPHKAKRNLCHSVRHKRQYWLQELISYPGIVGLHDLISIGIVSHIKPEREGRGKMNLTFRSTLRSPIRLIVTRKGSSIVANETEQRKIIEVGSFIEKNKKIWQKPPLLRRRNIFTVATRCTYWQVTTHRQWFPKNNKTKTLSPKTTHVRWKPSPLKEETTATGVTITIACSLQFSTKQKRSKRRK